MANILRIIHHAILGIICLQKSELLLNFISQFFVIYKSSVLFVMQLEVIGTFY